MSSRSLGHRAPLLWLALPLAAGLLAGRAGLSALPVFAQLGVATAAAGLALWASGRAPAFWAPAITTAMMLAGSASYTLHRARLTVWDALPPREARVTLRVDRAFPASDARKASGLATILESDTHLRELGGQRVYFSLALPKGGAAPIRSAVVSTIGILVPLSASTPPGSFDGYLVNAGMNFRLTRGRITAEVKSASAYYKFCDRSILHFSGLLSRGVDARQPELTAVFRAMLLGQKHELSDEQGTLFMRSGTMHLFAISGLHIAMIATALHALLALLRLPHLVWCAAQLIALWLYVDITGAAPSAVRAFIMVALLETSLLLQAPRNPIAALAASAFVVLVFWPLQLFSASFQLSYMIVAALLLLGLPLGDAWQAHGEFFRDLPRPAWRWHHHALSWLQRQLFSSVAIGVATTLISTAGGLLFFQLFTPGALFANLVLIPAALFVILGGFASLLTGLLGAGFLSALFNHASVLVLWGVNAVVQAVVQIPGTWYIARFSSAWIGPTSTLLLIAALVVGYRGGWRRQCGGWWPPFVVVAVTLLLGVDFE